MDREAILGVLRHILTSAGGGLVTGGVFTSDELTTAVGLVIGIIGFAWSYWSKKHPQTKEPA